MRFFLWSFFRGSDRLHPVQSKQCGIELALSVQASQDQQHNSGKHPETVQGLHSGKLSLYFVTINCHFKLSLHSGKLSLEFVTINCHYTVANCHFTFKGGAPDCPPVSLKNDARATLETSMRIYSGISHA